MKERVYIAGPMRHYPEFNFPAFDEAEHLLTVLGYHPISPASIDRDVDDFDPAGMTGFEPDWGNCELSTIIERDIAAVISCNSIYMLRGWERSNGATAEHAVAVWAGLNIYYETSGL
jgi:hypothetical protein